ncbi:MAG: rRNA maturation RNAse YbeY [candidate division WOR-3 bacterium]|nr:MAG: rRNA maturation RNAse YbeY [candidate division WOR-3 bacterium]
MKINIFNECKDRTLNEKHIRRLVRKVVKKEKAKLGTLNIIITDNAYLRGLNRMFLKKNRVTNVISFTIDDVSEIYVSREKSRSNEELFYFILHGLLHVIGYEHNNKQEELRMEDKCLAYLSNA